MRLPASTVSLVAAALLAAPSPAPAQATTPQALYLRAQAHERAAREAGETATLDALRAAVRAYETVVRRFPRSGYCDDALWNGAQMALLAYDRFRQDADRRTAVRLLRWLRAEYPSSRLAARAAESLARLAATGPAPAAASDAKTSRTSSPTSAPGLAGTSAPASTDVSMPSRPAVIPPSSSFPPASPAAASLVRLTRQRLPAGVRVVMELDAEVSFREERLMDPPRVFVDLKGVRVGSGVDRQALLAADDVIRAIRVGQHPDQVTRVVMELTGPPRYSIFALYDPFRLVIDFEAGAVDAPAGSGSPPRVVPTAPGPSTPAPAPPDAPIAASPTNPTVLSAPAAPARNSDGSFSLARQLGLGVSRIVIDPGHGGHDPGARTGQLTEAEVALDIALRVEALLAKDPGLEVVLTRRADLFVPLEERTAIANREGADLFLSIHVNASRNAAARGVETYYLNFATDPEAEAVAARENSASGRGMRNLPDLVRAIALNNKINESRDLARHVQQAMVRTLRRQQRAVRDLGVKQAPFVVLIGAQMPSVLAEVAFITNRVEAGLLAQPTYRQRIAQALADAVLAYQRSLKRSVAMVQRTAQ